MPVITALPPTALTAMIEVLNFVELAVLDAEGMVDGSAAVDNVALDVVTAVVDEDVLPADVLQVIDP